MALSQDNVPAAGSKSDGRLRIGRPADGTRHVAGLAMVASAAIIWSSGGLIVRTLSTDGWTTIFWRSSFACLFIGLFILARERGRFFAAFRELGLPGLIAGMFFGLSASCYVIALQWTSVANFLVLLSISPVVAAILARIFLGERIRPRLWPVMAMAVLGILVMEYGSLGTGAWVGDLLALACGGTFAVATVIIRHNRHVRMQPAACIAMGFAALVMILPATPGSASSQDLALLLLFGGGQLASALMLYTAGARFLPVAEATLVSLLEMAFGPIWVWLVYDERPGLYTLIGGAILVGAIAGSNLLELAQQRRVAGAPA